MDRLCPLKESEHQSVLKKMKNSALEMFGRDRLKHTSTEQLDIKG